MASKGTRKLVAAICPACGDAVSFRKLPRRGNLVTCHQCESLLKVAQAVPLRLEWAFEDPLDEEYLGSYSNGGAQDGSQYDDYEDNYNDDVEEWNSGWYSN